jgi:hypothetical protein
MNDMFCHDDVCISHLNELFAKVENPSQSICIKGKKRERLSHFF